MELVGRLQGIKVDSTNLKVVNWTAFMPPAGRAAAGSVFPDLPKRIKFTELSTPLSTEYFTRWGRGDSYGLPMIPERFTANNGQGFGPATPLKGLYLTGQDVSGDGVASAMMSGVFAAVAAGGLKVLLGFGAECRKWK